MQDNGQPEKTISKILTREWQNRGLTTIITCNELRAVSHDEGNWAMAFLPNESRNRIN